MAAHLMQRAGDTGHRRRCDGALIRTAEHARHVAAHRDRALVRGAHHLLESLQALGNGTVNVLLREGFRRRSEHRHLIGAGRQRRLEALEVGCQCRISHSGSPRHAAHHRIVIGHLRYPPG